MMSNKATVYVVDDDYAVRDGISLIVESAGYICQTFGSGEQFLECYKGDNMPACLLLDVKMPGMDGHDLQDELIQRKIKLPIIFLTAYGDIPMTVRSIKAGAVDFLTKPAPRKKLLACIQSALDIETEKFRQAQSERAFLKRMENLTPREKEILPLALEGIPNKEIAKKLRISYRTVEIHRIKILQKTGTNNFLELSKLFEANKVSPF